MILIHYKAPTGTLPKTKFKVMKKKISFSLELPTGVLQ